MSGLFPAVTVPSPLQKAVEEIELVLMRECSPGVWIGRARNARDEEIMVQYEKLTGITVSAMKERGGGTHALQLDP